MGLMCVDVLWVRFLFRCVSFDMCLYFSLTHSDMCVIPCPRALPDFGIFVIHLLVLALFPIFSSLLVLNPLSKIPFVWIVIIPFSTRTSLNAQKINHEHCMFFCNTKYKACLIHVLLISCRTLKTVYVE